MKWNWIFTLIVAVALVSCKKDKNTDENPTTGSVQIKLHHLWDTDSLLLDSLYVHPVTSDTLSFTTFKYYVSNIRLKKTDGTWYSVPESYHLIDLGNGSTNSLTISNVPTGNYSEISILFGVDSTRNVSGAQSGALSTIHGMFWSWNTGYIMLKAEGLSPNSTSGSYAFHLGGFQGPNSVLKTKNFVLSTIANSSVTGSNLSKIGIQINASNMWNSSPNLATVSDLQMAGAAANTMATDFVSGWTLSYVNN
jgi:hypothetical protein